MAIKIEVWDKDEIARLGLTQDEYGHYFQVLYEGCVITYRSRGLGGGDSAGYALVWDPENQRLGWINYYYNGLGGTDDNSATPDITPENLAAARAFAAPKIAAIVRGGFERDAAEVRSGRRVRVTGGRKYPLGTEALVKWAGETRFGFAAKLAFDDGSEGWIDLNKVEVVNPTQYLPSEAVILEAIRQHSNCFDYVCPL